MTTHETPCNTRLPMIQNAPVRIKSPQLYRLSYRPLLGIRSFWSRCVSLVYPVLYGRSTVPRPPPMRPRFDSDDDCCLEALRRSVPGGGS